ncbi:MAG: Hsp20/alpha crystallin family protein [Leptolinea sp.]
MAEYSKSGMINLRGTYQTNYYQPPVDVIETTTGFIVRIEIAGMDEKDFDIKINQNILSVNGIRRDPNRNLTFYQMEIHFGEFRIEQHMNQPIRSDAISTKYQNGFLEILLQKTIAQEISITDKDA